MLTKEQLTELERQLSEAEREWAKTEKDGPAQQFIAFKATEYLRLTLAHIREADDGYAAAIAKLREPSDDLVGAAIDGSCLKDCVRRECRKANTCTLKGDPDTSVDYKQERDGMSAIADWLEAHKP